MNNFLDKGKIKFEDLVTQVNQYLRSKYSASRKILTPSSPYGQILTVIQNLAQLIFFYIEDSINELNIFTAYKQKSIFGLSRLTGHNPTRPISAQGEIGLKISPSARPDIESNNIFLNNYTKIENVDNGLPYTIFLEEEKLNIPKSSNEIIKVRLVQGEVTDQTVISLGTPLQSFNITDKDNIADHDVYIYVNGEGWDIVDSLYDMNKGDKKCIVKTGIGGGIDVIFGNEDWGTIPIEGATIKVQYLRSNGFTGTIDSRASNLQWKFVDSGEGSLGEEIDFNEVFLIRIEKPIILGSDGEDIEVTKLIAGANNRALVLARPENYVHFLSRYNQFSYIDAYTTFDDENLDDDNIVYLFMVPNVEKKLSTTNDYFTVSEELFKLDKAEKTAIYSVINKSGRQLVTSEVRIQDPIITKYICNVYVRVFENYDRGTIISNIKTKLSTYFTSVRRRDKIPKSDIVSIVENIKGIDTVNVEFVSEKNENAIKNGFYVKTIENIDPLTKVKTVGTQRIDLTSGDDPGLGIDNFGDIIIGLNEVPIIRGGWDDRNEVTYQKGIQDNKLSSLNVVIVDKVKEDVTAKLAANNKSNI
tara:strand:- start:2985 stop:4745 length:1761 start_codon:yes stop_codon:yes gene_type:complete